MRRIVKTNGSITFKLKLPKHLKENRIARVAKIIIIIALKFRVGVRRVIAVSHG